ncbi:hypothetical protein B296_00033609 [Ensete ventricosum]|uniref:Uncharacterized protein n=1 Tax=Ensete ventricosum TaxID=4639 RepID=A0A426XQP0_ENSVE|nr:hypothetical protein B296_00033609 [Ensete ventricosum]
MAVGDPYWQRLCSKRSLLAATKEDGSERSLLVALYSERSLLAMIKVDGYERPLLLVFVQQEIAVGYDQGSVVKPQWEHQIRSEN